MSDSDKEEEDYYIYKTTDGIEIVFSSGFNKTIEHLPEDVTIILLNNGYNQPIDYLPNKVENIHFGSDFNHPIDNLPNGLKFVQFGAHFNQPINNLPESVEEIRISQFYDCEIKKLPKSLKIFNVIHMTQQFIDFVNDETIIETEPKNNYYEIYYGLELKYPNVKFYY